LSNLDGQCRFPYTSITQHNKFVQGHFARHDEVCLASKTHLARSECMSACSLTDLNSQGCLEVVEVEMGRS